MIFSKHSDGEQLFKDRVFVRKLLLSGRDTASVTKLVDSITLCSTKRPAAGQPLSKRPKVQRTHPRKTEVVAVLNAFITAFPRLGAWDPEDQREHIALKSWGNSRENEIKFHNDLMRCCHVSLYDLSQKRSRFVVRAPKPRPAGLRRQGGAAPSTPPFEGEHGARAPGLERAVETPVALLPPPTPPGGHP